MLVLLPLLPLLLIGGTGRFLIVRPHSRAGLGNRVRAVTGALALAVLTDRALLLDFGARSGDTEAGLFLPRPQIDWRPPAPPSGGRGGVGGAAAPPGYRLGSWPHGWSPYADLPEGSGGGGPGGGDSGGGGPGGGVGSGVGVHRPLRRGGEVRYGSHGPWHGDKQGRRGSDTAAVDPCLYRVWKHHNVAMLH